ncbi:MAG: SDR family oxidoreductase [Candidatus Marinimicrobia bacterium]|nr:SDR family oxidoreductase [Candidatus Neomarinimicrobiota bacterium]
MSKKILITGASGQLGNSVLNQLNGKYELLATDINTNILKIPFSILDITNFKQIQSTLTNFNPDVIINLAAFTDVDGCELNPDKAYLLNAKSVEMLSNNFDGQFIQISTDYVFDGYNGPYSEDDNTNPLSIYGKTKLEAEKILQEGAINWCILRTNVLFDYFRDTEASFIKWVIDSLKSNKSIKVVDDQWNNPTWTQNLAEIIELVVNKNITGFYNYGGADYLNRFEFAKVITNIFNLDKTLISPISTNSLNQAAQRPLKGGLKTEKIEEEFDIQCVDLKTSLNLIKSRLTE